MADRNVYERAVGSVIFAAGCALLAVGLLRVALEVSWRVLSGIVGALLGFADG